MATELNLQFPNASHVVVRLGEEDSGELPFSCPLTDQDVRDLAWYVETYGAHSLGDPDDAEARRIAGHLPVWGRALFDAVFADRAAARLFNAFQDVADEARLLTISAEHPDILALPWELLHDPAMGGGFLFMETPRISIRRRVAGATGGRGSFKPASKDALHLLFVVSRPADTGFLDPRADAKAVLDAIDAHAPGRVTWEFLRPPTLDALLQRLEDTARPPVDILHFDGHGVFDREGNLPNRAAAAQSARRPGRDEIQRDKKVDVPVDPESPPNTGYLLFETRDGTTDFVSANKLGANLHRHRVGLVILSACQSATIGREETTEDGQPDRPMGSVAARLTATGIPSVLAMTHAVLVPTTRVLFGAFYRELAKHKGIGEALDNARRYLANHPEKYAVQRGPERVPLKLYDWFLPALYQQGADVALLKQTGDPGQQVPARSNLPNGPEAGFFGRRRQLWEIERWYAGPTRRVTLTGFGGQGKTALAQEAGRWLTRTGLFEAAVFVDYARVQAIDAVAVAKNEIGRVLDQTLLDADAATAALQQTPTLVILDNLEALAPEALRALLDAAVPWSEAGGSRVLCTTRQPDFGHAAYRVEGTQMHRRLQLDGLGSTAAPDDALEWYAALMTLPPAPTVPAPKREALIALFERVRFHPLSIRVLAQQLKTRRLAEVGERLEQLLVAAAQDAVRQPHSAPSDDTPIGLLASLELSLDRLDAAAREVLPRLGVFQGGAFEDDLCAITGLGDPYEAHRLRLQQQLAAADDGRVRLEGDREVPPDVLAQLTAKLRAELAELPPAPAVNLWPELRRQLEAAALVEVENIPGVAVPFLRFHPTLAPMLWARLDAPERARLTTAHWQRYYALSSYLYQQDHRRPYEARAIAWRELPNLVHAVHAALDAGDPDAVDFTESVNRFLTFFGLTQEAEQLWAKAQQAAPHAGSRAWFLAQSNRGEQLFAAGQVTGAAQVFQTILQHLGDSPTYERAVTLGRQGRCSLAGGRPDLAVQCARDAISDCEKLEQTDAVRTLRSYMLTDMADALRIQGKLAEARKAYLEGLEIVDDLGDLRSQGVTLGQLGALAMREGMLGEATERYRDALTLFQQLREPASEAVAWHQLGVVFQRASQWDEAERHYRESARIEEELGNLSGAAKTWNQLALVSSNAGKLDAAELWLRKAIEGGRTSGDLLPTSRALSNLAALVSGQPGRLTEARQLASEALAIKRTLDPGAAEIWTTYLIFSEIAEREAVALSDGGRKAELQAQAREYRRLAREARRSFPGTRHELRRHAPKILGTILAVHDAAQRQPFEELLQVLEQKGWSRLVASLRRVVAGERDPEVLCADLDIEDSVIVDAILTGLRDPSTFADLLPSELPAEELS